MLVRNKPWLLCRFSGNNLPVALTTTILDAMVVQPTTITDLRFNKADIAFGSFDITSHELICLKVSKNNLLPSYQEPRPGDWLIPADSIESVSAYVASYSPTTGMFGTETLLFDQVPTSKEERIARILCYSFTDSFLFITCILTKQIDNAASIYFDGRYTLLNSKFPYTLFNRQIYKL